MEIVVKVSKLSRVAGVAGAIAGIIREGNRAVVQSVGLESTDRAVIAIALASRYLNDEGRPIAFIPEMFCTDGERKLQGIRFTSVVVAA